MADIYLNADTGDDTTGDGSEGNPYRDLPKGFDESNPGDTIILQDAVLEYTFDTRFFTDITLRGEEIGTRTIRVGQGPGSVINGGNAGNFNPRWEFDGSITMELIRFTNITSFPGLTNIAMFNWGNNNNDTTLVVDRCVFDNCRFSSNATRGGMFSAQNLITGSIELHVTFTGCEFNDIRKGSAVPTNVVVMIGARGSNADSTVTIRNCTIYQLTGGGEHVPTLFRSQGGLADWDVRNVIFNNASAINVTIFNEAQGVDTVVDFNNIYPIADYTIGGGYTNPNGTNFDPQFVDAGNGDFNLHPASPVRFTGTLL